MWQFSAVKRQPILLIFCGVVLGILVGYYYPVVFNLKIYTLIFFGLLGLQIGLHMLKSRFQALWATTTSVFLGFGLIASRNIENFNNHYANLSFSAYQVSVMANAEPKPASFKVLAEVVAVHNKSWKSSHGKILLYFRKEDGFEPKYGDLIYIKAKPRLVEGPKNPFEFDYRAFLAQKHILYHHFLRKNHVVKIASTDTRSLNYWANRASYWADSVFQNGFKDKQAWAVASAMTLGVKSQLDQDLVNAFSATGAIHVLSVSGMHVAILYVILAAILGKIIGHSKKRTLSGVLIVLLWAYALLTGLSVTVIRATVMFSFVEFGKILGRKAKISNALMVSALALLIFQPLWLFDVGFQLSYLAILGIVYLHPKIFQFFTPQYWALRKLWEISSVALSAQLATFPLSVFYFHQFPNYFLLANPFVFLFSEGILPLGLFYLAVYKIPYLNDLTIWLLETTTWLLNQAVLLIESLPMAVSKGLSINKVETLLFYSLIFLMIGYFKTKKRSSLILFTVLMVAVVGFNFNKDLNQGRQSAFVVHYIPRKSGISLLQGKTAVFMADSTNIKDEKLFNFHLKNMYDQCGISTVSKKTNAKIMDVFVYKTRKIVWLHKFPKKIEHIPKANVLIVSNGALRYFKHKIPVDTIIADDSNRQYVVKNLSEDAKRHGIAFFSLYENGAFIIN